MRSISAVHGYWRVGQPHGCRRPSSVSSSLQSGPGKLQGKVCIGEQRSLHAMPLSPTARQLLAERYAQNGESPEAIFRRVANAVDTPRAAAF
ncbi:MAG: hypothetical protein EHJ95_05695, partial [Methanobacteriota archaeon]